VVTLSIKKISLYGFALLCSGALISGVILISLVLKYESIQIEQKIINDAHDAIFSLRYNTEKLLTTHKLTTQKKIWQASAKKLESKLDTLNLAIPDQSIAINELWRVIQKEMNDIARQLSNPLFNERNIMEKSLLRRLGEGFNANESSAYYVDVRTLVNAIDYLQQYEAFLLDDITTLIKIYSSNSVKELQKTKNLLVMVPILAFIVLSGFAVVLFLLSRNAETKLLTIQSNLSSTLSELEQEQNKLKEHRDILDHMAHHDSLTGYPNRLLFLEQLKQAIKSAKRNNQKLAILFIDLDRFKEVNDSLGHSAGDEVLKVAATRFGTATKKEDNFARLGGDEFTILIESVKSKNNLKNIAQRIIGLMKEPISIDEHELYMTCSLGLSIFPDDGDSAETLLRNADSAMYKAKAEGKNTYQFYNREMTRNAYERVKLESNMSKALEKNQFELFYQPQIDPRTNEISFEALIRWRHTDFGIISPASFIPIAEESGLIISLGEWVLDTACKQIVLWRDEDLNIGRIAVNVAGKQLHDKKFYKTVLRILENNNCKPDWLALEVTEGMIMRNPTLVIQVLKKLNEQGIKIAIDDFGTGYSSLSYLKSLPIDQLKIDQSFVRNTPHNSDDSEIIKAVISLAKGLQMSVTAEGVENEEQKDFLVNAGCNKLQGYLYSKPIPVTEVLPFLQKYYQTSSIEVNEISQLKR